MKSVQTQVSTLTQGSLYEVCNPSYGIHCQLHILHRGEAYTSLCKPYSAALAKASLVQGAGSCRAAEVWGPPMAVEGL